MRNALRLTLGVVGVGVLAGAAAKSDLRRLVKPDSLPAIARLDERFQSYNIEMVEVTGGQFWKPYEQVQAAAQQQPPPQPTGAAAGGGGGQANVYAQAKTTLAPIDLSNPRLRKLAAALGPAYVRVSGGEANAVYFHDSDQPPPKEPPSGFLTVLTRNQWRGVIDFAKAVDARIVTSFAISEGVRDAQGRWKPDQARARIRFTKSVGGSIAAAELANEPNIGPTGAVNTPPGYDVQTFARDFQAFRQLARKEAPNMKLLGPGSTSEGVKIVPGEIFSSTSFFTANPRPVFDAFSYHAYGASSMRCAGPERVNTTAAEALSGEWLARSDVFWAYYDALRNKYMPGKELWNTETAQSSCGADPWAKTYLDTIRYLDQLAQHARRGVHTVIYNTLAVSDYGLLDGTTFEPRPNYWAALLWRRLMGTTVLVPNIPIREGLHLYAHCLRGNDRGAVVLLAINNSHDRSTAIELQKPAQRHTLGAPRLDDERAQLNGRELRLRENGELPAVEGQAVQPGVIEFAPATSTFLVIADAQNRSCR